MPTNLYGSFDNFDLKSSHVLPAMLRKFHEAKLNNHSDVVLWGSGTPMREFLFVDDMAEAVVYALENNLPDYLYNIGTGKDITIKELAETIKIGNWAPREIFFGMPVNQMVRQENSWMFLKWQQWAGSIQQS